MASTSQLCTDLMLTQAWTEWAAGSKLEDNCLWGFKILWLARLGKIVTALAGTVVFVDIFGEELIRKFGILIFSRLYRSATVLFCLLLIIAGSSISYYLYVATAYLVSTADVEVGQSPYEAIWPVFLEIASYSAIGIIFLIIFPFAMLLTVILISGFLRYNKIGNALRIISFFLICVGFHFDLLGS